MEREIIVTTREPIPQTNLDNKILVEVNEAMGGQFRFIFAKATSKHTIILRILTDWDCSSGQNVYTEIRIVLNKIVIIAAAQNANSMITKFIVDGMPTNVSKYLRSGFFEMVTHIAYNYCKIELAQVTVWMCCPESMRSKVHTAMIIFFKGTYTIDSLGRRSIVISNMFCRL